MPDKPRSSRYALLGATALTAALSMFAAAPASAESPAYQFSQPAQPLASALRSYSATADQEIIFADRLVAGRSAPELNGAYTAESALMALLDGTGLKVSRTATGVLLIQGADADPQSGSAAGGGAEVEALIVTAQKREEDIQDVPIAMSAFTQEQLERSQIAGGPDLITQVPNMTFTKTNFSGYSIQIRGIGTQAISATTDAAVAVAFNNTPFIRNRFFEQEFYDLQRVEVLRGPQGTLYGRNATAGVVNVISQKPKFAYEAKLSADVSNYNSTRLEGMVNIPLAEDKVALRLAGAWTKRDGYVTNEITGNPIDGRDLWSSRISLRAAPTDGIEANLIWEHFEENDDRLRSGKQLCHRDDRTEIAGYSVPQLVGYAAIFSQGCLAASLYSPDSYEAPNGYSLPYYQPLASLGFPIPPGYNPYASLVQSSDLRVIESTVDPEYWARNDLIELQVSADIGQDLTFTSETGYNFDNLFSLEDYNRFNTARGAFNQPDPNQPYRTSLIEGEFGGIFCDPQVGCADRVVAVDVSRARSRQFSQEFRLSSDYDGAFNFSLGANFLRYDTEDKYYVFINTLTLFAARGGQNVDLSLLQKPYIPGVTDNHECLPDGGLEPDPDELQLFGYCIYIDPNDIHSVNDLGHNYFLSKNPYKLISYAVFGESYYNITEDLKLTAGLRWTVDKKEAPRIPSWLLASDTIGYPVLEVYRQEWREPTGRLALDWKPKLSFTDETLLYASYAHGYKAGGSNPPPSGIAAWGLHGLDDEGGANDIGERLRLQSALKPRKFDAEFLDAFEVGAKNTLLGGRMTLNANAFYYDYKDYQISQIIDRSAVNYNFDAQIWGMEVEADWRPLENLRFGFKGGYENTKVGDGESAIDIMDRTGGHDDWVVVRPFPSYPSNCILPIASLDTGNGDIFVGPGQFSGGTPGPCEVAYALGLDPATNLEYVANPTVQALAPFGTPMPFTGRAGYAGYDPDFDVGQNNGEGFVTDLSGNELPNAPHFTATITADYTLPLPSDWLMTLHTDLYYQSEAWTRIFNTEGYDKLKAYTNVNLAAIFTNEEAGWKVMAYIKNVMDRDSITGAFLNSDDSGLTTNVFLTEPRLFGLRVTKDWNGAWWGGDSNHPTGEPYPLTVEFSGMLQRHDAAYDPVQSAGPFEGEVDPDRAQNQDLGLGGDVGVKLTYAVPNSPWRVSGGVRSGKVKTGNQFAGSQPGGSGCAAPAAYAYLCDTFPQLNKYVTEFSRGEVIQREDHLIVDFEVGHDVGLGAGMESTIRAGIRYADFESLTRLEMTGVPHWDLQAYSTNKYESQHDFYNTDLTADRAFTGFGPTLSWDAAKTLWGDEATGHLDADLSLTGGVLFGKQKTSVQGVETSTYYSAGLYPPFSLPDGPPTPTAQPGARSTSTTVPIFSGALGLSYEIQRAKISAGYRWERYFDVLDAGYAEHKDYDRTIDGPYFKIAVGFGG